MVENLDQLGKLWPSLEFEYENIIRRTVCDYLRIVAKATEKDDLKKVLRIENSDHPIEYRIDTAVYNIQRDFVRLKQIKSLLEKDKVLLVHLEKYGGLYFLGIQLAIRKIDSNKIRGLDDETLLKDFFRMDLTSRKFYFTALKYVQSCSEESSRMRKKTEDLKVQGEKIFSKKSGTGVMTEESERDFKNLCKPVDSISEFDKLREWAEKPEIQLPDAATKPYCSRELIDQLQKATKLFLNFANRYHECDTIFKDLEKRTESLM